MWPGVKLSNHWTWLIIFQRIPVVPHKAVAEVSERTPIGEFGCCELWMAERIH